jgi:hypothetical protein
MNFENAQDNDLTSALRRGSTHIFNALGRGRADHRVRACDHGAARAGRRARFLAPDAVWRAAHIDEDFEIELCAARRAGGNSRGGDRGYPHPRGSDPSGSPVDLPLSIQNS